MDVINGSKASQAYQAIESMIVHQELAPGTLVSETFLMERTALGRTPVREALQQLARNRMVEIHAGRGVLVPPNSVEAELRMLQTRRVLDALAVRLGSSRASRTEREEMRDLAARLDHPDFTLREYADTIRETHSLVARCPHNEYLADALAPLQGLSRRFWYSRVVDVDTEITAGARLHGTLLRAIADADAEAAETASAALHDYLAAFARAALDHD